MGRRLGSRACHSSRGPAVARSTPCDRARNARLARADDDLREHLGAAVPGPRAQQPPGVNVQRAVTSRSPVVSR